LIDILMTKPDLIKRLDETRNEVYGFDLGRLTLLGWAVVLVSLAVGVAAAWATERFLYGGQPPPPVQVRPGQQGGPATIGAKLVAVAGLAGGVISFLFCKVVVGLMGVSFIRPPKVGGRLAGLLPSGMGAIPTAANDVVEWNSAIRTKLKKRITTTNLWLLFWCLYIPLGCTGVLGLGRVLSTDLARDVVPWSGVAIPLVSTIAIVVCLYKRSQNSDLRRAFDEAERTGVAIQP
jgi:hypothetical protein